MKTSLIFSCIALFFGLSETAKAQPSNHWSVIYSSYLGGDRSDGIFAITTDARGNLYVLSNGDGRSSYPRTASVAGPESENDSAMFISKFDPSGATLIYSTFLGVSRGYELAVDAGENVYVTGLTYEQPSLVTNAFQPNYGGGNADSFVLKLDASGTNLLYWSYLGGNGVEFGQGPGPRSVGQPLCQRHDQVH